MKDKIPSRIYFNSTISKFEKIKNTGFLLGRARIAYPGVNRNDSYISREAFDNALDSLSLIPVVGNWIPEKNNFGGHDYAIEDEGNSIKIVEKTRPYGVVMENHNAEWVDVEDKEGNIKKYLECDVVLWEDRYQEPVKKIIDGGVNQSMEIIPSDASYNEETGLFDINSFYYSALCILGRDEENPENDVEPCFEDAQITAYQFNLDKEEFKSEFSLMMDELIGHFKGGESVGKEFEELEENVEELENNENHEEETKEETVLEEDFEDTESQEEVSEEGEVEENFTKTFELSHDDIRSKLYRLLDDVEKADDKWYWINKVYDDYFIYSTDSWESDIYYKQKYIKTDVDIAFEGERIEIFVEYLTASEAEELKKIRSEYQSLVDFKAEKDKEEFELKQAEIKQEKIDHINSEYSNIAEDVKEMFISKVDEYESIEDIDADMCVYIVKNKVSFTKVNKKDNSTVKIGLEDVGINPVVSPYGSLFSK